MNILYNMYNYIYVYCINLYHTVNLDLESPPFIILKILLSSTCSHRFATLVHHFSTMGPTSLAADPREKLAGRHVNSQMGQQAAGHLRGHWDMNGDQTPKKNVYLNLIVFMNLEKIVLQ